MRYVLIWLWWLFLNLNHFRITQAQLCLKRTFAKACFMSVAIFLDIYENPRRKKFVNPSYPKHPKLVIWKKNDKFLFSHFFAVPQKGFVFLRLQRGSVKINNLSFFLLISDWDNKVKVISLFHFSFLNNEIYENNTDSSRVTNKQYYKIILFPKAFVEQNRHFQRVTGKYHRLFPGKL